MNYYICSMTEKFEKDNIYHITIANNETEAACIYALNEESLYGICDKEYKVFSADGIFLHIVDVSDRKVYKPKENNISTGNLDDTIGKISVDNTKCSNHSIIASGTSLDISGKSEDDLTLDNNTDNYCDDSATDEASFNCVNDCLSEENSINDLLIHGIYSSENKGRYSLLIAKQFLKYAQFSKDFIKSYGFFIGEFNLQLNDNRLMMAPNYSIELVFTDIVNESNWANTFSRKELDQLHNVMAILRLCGINVSEITRNIWVLTSTKWNSLQIKSITILLLKKCHLYYTRKVGTDMISENFKEALPKVELPKEFSFLI